MANYFEGHTFKEWEIGNLIMIDCEYDTDNPLHGRIGTIKDIYPDSKLPYLIDFGNHELAVHGLVLTPYVL